MAKETMQAISEAESKARQAVLDAKAEAQRLTEDAQAQGESVNGFVNRAIDETMERDKGGTEHE